MGKGGDDNMLMGCFSHALDAKGRIIIPSKLRDRLGDVIVLTKGLDGCLSLYTLEKWQELTDKLSKLPTTKKDARTYVRLVLGNAHDLEFDKQGRINIPANLQAQAGLEKECTIIGVYDHIEIWSAKKYADYIETAQESFEDVVENLVDFEV